MFDRRNLTSGGVGAPVHKLDGHEAAVLCVQACYITILFLNLFVSIGILLLTAAITYCPFDFYSSGLLTEHQCLAVLLRMASSISGIMRRYLFIDNEGFGKSFSCMFSMFLWGKSLKTTEDQIHLLSMWWYHSCSLLKAFFWWNKHHCNLPLPPSLGLLHLVLI